MKSSENVTRRQSIAFIGVVVLAIYSMQHDSEQLTVYAKSNCPYEIILDSETVPMQKSYNKDKNKWESYDVYVYHYKYDGIEGLYIDCPELDKSLDLYGYSKYEVLKFDDDPAFNIKIDGKLYMHPEESTGTFMLVD